MTPHLCLVFFIKHSQYVYTNLFTGKTPKIYDIDEITKMFHLNERREEFRALCEKYTEKWKEKPVKFGITGASSTGKSSFINAITGLKEHENGFAETSPYGDTTKVAKCYSHPKNPKFELWDLPGVGTVNYKLRNYVKDMSLEEYDYFLIFFNVIVEQDIELAMKLKRLDKPLCFVRSKLDLETQNEMQDENTTIDTFYKKALTDLEKEGMGYVDVFVISSKNTALGNFESLMNHMQDNLSVGQYAAVIHSLSLMSEPVIRQKYEIITRRLGIIYIASMYFIKHDLRYTTYTKQIRSDIILTNLTEEVMGYIDTFELTKQTIERLHVMEHSAFKMKVILNKTDEQIKTFIKDKLQLQNVKMIEEDCSFTFLPGQIESFLFHSEKLLKDILVNLKEDALQVLKRLVTNPVV